MGRRVGREEEEGGCYEDTAETRGEREREREREVNVWGRREVKKKEKKEKKIRDKRLLITVPEDRVSQSSSPLWKKHDRVMETVDKTRLGLEAKYSDKERPKDPLKPFFDLPPLISLYLSSSSLLLFYRSASFLFFSSSSPTLILFVWFSHDSK